MRVLLDECLPRRLKAHLAPHQVITVPEAGWAGTKDAELGARSNRLADLLPLIPKVALALNAVQAGQGPHSGPRSRSSAFVMWPPSSVDMRPADAKSRGQALRRREEKRPLFWIKVPKSLSIVFVGQRGIAASLGSCGTTGCAFGARCFGCGERGCPGELQVSYNAL
jgi:hypothetical protein